MNTDPLELLAQLYGDPEPMTEAEGKEYEEAERLAQLDFERGIEQ